MFRAFLFFLLILSFSATGYVIAADQDQDRDRIRLDEPDMDQDRDQLRTQNRLNDDEPIYGRQLMTEKERYEYREQMRALQTKEEREQFRMQHHKEMQKRAKAMGKTLPEDPLPRKGQGYDSSGRGGKGQGAQ